MNIRIKNLPFLCYFGLFCSLCFTACSTMEEPPKKAAEALSSVDRKHRPYDHFFLQRSFPEASLDIQQYESVLRSAKFQARNGNLPLGFGEVWTEQGPGNIGGRINTIAIHPQNDDIMYAGLPAGGVFKTTDGGDNWFPIFDEASNLAVGHIQIDPSNANTIYVGTGDPNIMAYPFIGDGLYRSRNGGESWEHLGLTDQRIISKVVIHPQDSNVIYAACMGLPFEKNNDRGVYKSIDGGQSWSQVLLVSDSTGVIDLLMDPQNPQRLYAATWDRIRNNFQSIVSGYGAGVFRTENGGQSWEKLTNGLPQGKFSRVGLTMSAVNPQTVFALFNDDRTFEVQGIYKTTDAGDSWEAITLSGQSNSVNGAMGGMGWYFGQLRVHPQDDDRLYVLGVTLWQSNTGGATWLRFGATPNGVEPHVDYHDLQFTSDASIIVGTDGGLYKLPSTDRNWQDIDNIPATQFYRIGYNPHRPETYYGGAQDNGTISGNKEGFNDWERILGGDGFQPVFHPTDSNIFYGEFQFGLIYRTADGGNRFTAAIDGIAINDPRNWDMPYFMSPNTPDLLYTGTNRVYRAQSPGQNSPWTAISQDLTNPIKTVPGFHTISTLDESPHQEDLLYVGTSDGNLWRTENAGSQWTSIRNGLPLRYITAVVASPDSADHVFVSFSGYKDNEFTPLLYKSVDRGQQWRSLKGDLPDFAINDFVVLPDRGEQALFVATDGGIYGSLNGGENWHRLGSAFPFVPVYDILHNVAKNELVAGTFARSILTYPLDSIDFDNNPSFRYSGRIVTASGEAVQGVRMLLQQGGRTSELNNGVDGTYAFDDISHSSELSIRPSKNVGASNGISAYDLVLISKHVLEIELLDDPYKIIAADANRSNSITAFDLVDIRRIILDVDTSFREADSWRFVLQDHVFSNPADPFEGGIPAAHIQNSPTSDASDIHFIGIKLGDVNGSANPSEAISTVAVEQRRKVSLEIPAVSSNEGERLRLPVYSKDLNGLSAAQFGLSFDADALEYVGVERGGLPNFSAESVGEKYRESGVLTFVWINPRS
ncbi:MAG: cohesin domain-containing protein, partial [Bacteroidota bacterium]